MNILIYVLAVLLAACGVYIIDATDIHLLGGLLVGIGLTAARWSGLRED